LKREIIASMLARLAAPLRPGQAFDGNMSFNPALSRALALDPAATALLPEMRLPMAVDSGRGELFRISARGTLLLAPALLSRPGLLGVAVRWAQEAAFLLGQAGADSRRRGVALQAAARHGEALFARLPAEDKFWFPADALAGLAKAFALEGDFAVAPVATELALPVEALLEAGGDARIRASAATGMNRYGATSRPRPEAVHFSSSTASSVSDYAFAALDRLRRTLLVEVLFQDLADGEANLRLADAVRGEILALHGLSEDEADVVLAPSGTDAETLAVLLALAADERLANILIAPEETGRGVKIAAAGRFFQDGGAFPVGEKIWKGADIEVSCVAVRDCAGRALPASVVSRRAEAAVNGALATGRRALLHVLIGSKTGIHAPSPEGVAALGAPSDRIDVVADSCQGRIAPETLGARVRAGWMAQISGSKFFTGPPFSGALIVPARLRERRQRAAELWQTAPALAPMNFWSFPWRAVFDPGVDAPASFGPLLRWAGALIEAALFRATAPDLARAGFEAFGAELRAHLATCRFLEQLAPPELVEGRVLAGDFDSFAGSSIICFAPRIDDGAGGLRRLDAGESEKLFRWLNADIADTLEGLDANDSALARQPFHIGQPVDLVPGAQPPNIILRLVIGARFFSTLAMAGPHSDAALDAEIADALRAVDKAELILANWGKLSAS